MPQEKGYDSQIMPRAGAMPRLSSPESYGAGLADAVGRTAGEFHNREVRAYRLDRQEKADREAADFDHRFALHRQNMDGIARELRANAAPGGAGHLEAIDKAYSAAEQDLFSGITEEAVARSARSRWDQFRTQLLDGEGAFEEGQRIAKLVTDRTKAIDVAGNRVRTSTDPETYKQELGQILEGIETIHGLPDGEKQKLRDYGEQVLGVGFVQQLQDSNPRLARAMLDAGTFNHLQPKVVEALRNGADVEIRRQDAAAAHELAVARSQLADQVATVTEKASQGIDVTAELPALRSAAEAAGDNSTVAKLDGLARDSAFARGWSTATPLQREARLAELSRIPAAKRSENEQAELKWLADKRGALDGQFNRDPVSWAMENAASKPPPLDRGLAARAQWARSVSQAYGRPMPIFTANEAAELRAQSAGSPAGQLEVANTLGALGGREAINAARQVAPGDAMLERLVTLAPEDRAGVQNGVEVRKGNRALVDGEAGNDALAAFNDDVGQALALFPPAQRSAVFEAARNLYANRAARVGQGEYHDGNFRSWIPRALGAQLTEWRGQKVLLPPGYDGTSFGRAIGLYKPRAGMGPVNADGTPMTGEQLRSFIPRLRPDGLYQFETPGGSQQVVRKDGTLFLLGLPERGR